MFTDDITQQSSLAFNIQQILQHLIVFFWQYLNNICIVIPELNKTKVYYWKTHTIVMSRNHFNNSYQGRELTVNKVLLEKKKKKKESQW